MDDRYQFQTRFVKICRWLRWMPYWYAWGLVNICQYWAFDRTIPNVTTEDGYTFPMYRSRWDATKSIMTLHKSMAQGKMKHYWSLQEVIADLHSQERFR